MLDKESKRPTSSIKEGPLLIIEKEKTEKEPSKWSEKGEIFKKDDRVYQKGQMLRRQ